MFKINKFFVWNILTLRPNPISIKDNMGVLIKTIKSVIIFFNKKTFYSIFFLLIYLKLCVDKIKVNYL